MSESDFSPESPQNLYGAFIEDLKQINAEVRPDEEIRDLIKITRDQNLSEEQRQQARNEIIEANLRTLPYVIKGLKKTGIPPEELVGQGFEILNNCIDNFNPEHISPLSEDKVKFSSYLFTSLRIGLSNAKTVEGVNQKLPLPQHVVDYSVIMKKVRENFLNEHFKEPNADEWYKATVDFLGKNRSLSSLKGFSTEVFDAAKTHQIEKRYVPIGKKVGRGNVNLDTLNSSIGNIEDTLVDPDESTENSAIKKMLEVDMGNVLTMLPDRERLVLKLRYGIGLNEEGKPIHPMTFEQIAPIIGLTRERIRQLERSALKKLRHPSRAKRIWEYADRSANMNKINEEKQRYNRMLWDAAGTLVQRRSKNEIVEDLRAIKNGSRETGTLDPLFLKHYFKENEIAELLEDEIHHKTSPRTLVKDLLNVLQEYYYNEFRNDEVKDAIFMTPVRQYEEEK